MEKMPQTKECHGPKNAKNQRTLGAENATQGRMSQCGRHSWHFCILWFAAFAASVIQLGGG
jgi:hypothetical protein